MVIQQLFKYRKLSKNDGIHPQWNQRFHMGSSACLYDKSETLEIIKQVEENLKADEKENFEAEATLVAMRTFLSMNGCLKK